MQSSIKGDDMINVYMDESGNVQYRIIFHLKSGENQQEFVKNGTVYSTDFTILIFFTAR